MLYSLDNISRMLQDRVRFLISAKTSIKVIKEEIDKVYTTIHQTQNYNDTYQLYSTTVPKGKRIKEYEKQYEQYFIVTGNVPGKIKVTIREEAVKQSKRYFGFFTLLSYENMDSIAALERYRNKDLIEKAFCNLKDRLNLRRTSVSSESSLEGKLFVEFAALIYLSYIKKKMQEKQLFKNYTIIQLLDKLDLIECFEHPGRKLRISEVLDKQKQLYIDMGVKTPL